MNGESTTRTKSLHKFHDPADIGEKPPSARTVYVSPEFAQEVGMWNTLSSTGKRIILSKDGKVQLISRGPGGKPGLDRIINDNSFSTTPEVGRAPLELFQPNESGHYAGNHPGNAITRVETAAEAPKVPVSKGMSVEQARGEFEGARKIPSDASFKVVQNPDKPSRWTVQVKSGDKHIGDLELVARGNELNVGLADLTKEYRGQGYGKAMYQEAIKLAQRLGKRYLTSGYSITEDAARVWRSLGAERFSNEVGMPADDPLSSRWRLPVPEGPAGATAAPEAPQNLRTLMEAKPAGQTPERLEARQAATLAREAEATLPKTVEEFRTGGEVEPPTQPGMVRLYRGEKLGEKPSAGWWTTNPEEAEFHALDQDIDRQGTHHMVYVDIPATDLPKYDALNHPVASGMVGPGESPYILPKEIAAKKATLWTTAQRPVTKAKPRAAPVTEPETAVPPAAAQEAPQNLRMLMEGEKTPKRTRRRRTPPER
jgi:hypothetical protein